MGAEVPEPGAIVIPSETVTARFLRTVNAPWFSYASLLLMQAVFALRFWRYRDITIGDTSFYYPQAYLWYKNFAVNIGWSPLYTAFYGTLMFLTRDAYIVTLLHRAIIVFAATTMVLALMRRMFPAWVAWSIALWWACLPINFETRYEVHLFAVLPILVGALIVAHRNTAWHRGAGLAVLVTTMALVRNETMIGVACFSLVCLVYESVRARAAGRPIWKGLLRESPAYLVPLLLAVAIISGAYRLSYAKGKELEAQLKSKHTVNMAQVYCFGYGQRHRDYTDNPWSNFGPLMTKTFGRDELTLGEMIRANPRAVGEHFWWNIRLLPNGLQLMLFNQAAGKVNPDYFPSQLKSETARNLSLAMLITIGLGGLISLVQRKYWWRTAMKDQIFIWLFLFSVAAATFAIVPTQRPRPSYLFPLSLTLMAVAGASVMVIVANLRMPARTSRWMLPAAIVVCTVVAVCNRPVHSLEPPKYVAAYRRLVPYQTTLADPRTSPMGFCADDCWRYASFAFMNVVPIQEFARPRSGTKPRRLARNIRRQLHVLRRRYPAPIATREIPAGHAGVERRARHAQASAVPLHRRRQRRLADPAAPAGGELEYFLLCDYDARVAIDRSCSSGSSPPQLKHEKRIEPLRMVDARLLVLVHHPLHRGQVKISSRERIGRE